MLIDITALDDANMLQLCDALIRVLDARVHRRIHLGKEVFVKGTLSNALKLPQLHAQLQTKQAKRRDAAKEAFAAIWQTLSEKTQIKTFDCVNWHDPKTLPWDDPRSNRFQI